MKCTLCNGDGYHEDDCTLKYVKSDFSSGDVSASFVAERYPGSPLLDTSVELHVERFCITWLDREKLVNELAEVIRKYQI